MGGTALIYPKDLPIEERNNHRIDLYPFARVQVAARLPAEVVDTINRFEASFVPHQLVFHLRSRTAQMGIEVIDVRAIGHSQYLLTLENRGTHVVQMDADTPDFYEVAVLQLPAITGCELEYALKGTPAISKGDHLQLPLSLKVVQGYRDPCPIHKNAVPGGRERISLYDSLGYQTVPIGDQHPDFLSESNLLLLATEPFSVPDGYVIYLKDVTIVCGGSDVNRSYTLNYLHHMSQLLRHTVEPITQVTECLRGGVSQVNKAFVRGLLFRSVEIGSVV